MEKTINPLSLARLTALKEEELKAKLFEEDGETLVDGATKILEDLILENSKARTEKRADDFFKKGLKEGATKVEERFEKLLKAVNIADPTDEAALEQLGKKLQGGQSKGKPAELTAEELEALPLFVQLKGQALKKETEALAAKLDTAEKQLQDERQRADRIKKRVTVKSALRQALEKADADFGRDAERALEAFMLSDGNRFKVEHGKLVALDEKGEPALDKYGDPVDPKQVLVGNDEDPSSGLWFLGKKAPARSTKSPGAAADSAQPSSVKRFRDYEDFKAQLTAAEDDAKAQAKLYGELRKQQLQHGPLK